MNGNSDKIKTFLVNNNVDVKNIERISHNESRYSSYKITVPVIDFNKPLDEKFWPNGFQCKKWYERKQSYADSNGNEDVFNNDPRNDYISGRPYDSVNPNNHHHG